MPTRPLPIVAACLVPALAGCQFLMALGGLPPDARRATPPVGIEQRVLSPQSRAPDIRLPSTAGEWSLERDVRHLIVFYRGDW